MVVYTLYVRDLAVVTGRNLDNIKREAVFYGADAFIIPSK